MPHLTLPLSSACSYPTHPSCQLLRGICRCGPKQSKALVMVAILTFFAIFKDTLVPNIILGLRQKPGSPYFFPLQVPGVTRSHTVVRKTEILFLLTPRSQAIFSLSQGSSNAFKCQNSALRMYLIPWLYSVVKKKERKSCSQNLLTVSRMPNKDSSFQENQIPAAFKKMYFFGTSSLMTIPFWGVLLGRS